MWTSSYLSPVLDHSQDLTDREGFVEDGVVTIKFSRKRDTGDSSQDVSFADDKGLFLIFPVKGGDFNAANRKLRKHQTTPSASSERIFIKACRNADGSPTFTTTPRPPQLVYEAKVKFVELGERYRLPVRGTREYKELQSRISRALEGTKISQVQGFVELQILKFKSTKKQFGEFEAEMMVVVDKEEYDGRAEDTPTVEEAIRDAVAEGRVGALQVEPESLVLQAPGMVTDTFIY